MLYALEAFTPFPVALDQLLTEFAAALEDVFLLDDVENRQSRSA